VSDTESQDAPLMGSFPRHLFTGAIKATQVGVSLDSAILGVGVK